MAATTDKTSTSTRGGLAPLVVTGAILAGFVAAGLTWLSGSRPLDVLGLPDPGPLTTYGLPVVRTLTECSAVLAVGALLMAVLLAPPPGLGYLDLVGYRALRLASYGAGGWAVGALLMVPLTVADSLGKPVTVVLGFGRLVGLVPQLDTAAAWALTAVVAVVLFGCCRVVLSWGGAVALGVLAVLTLLPVASTGHSSAGGAHDLATDSLMLHVVAAALWVGGLVALLALAGGPDRVRLPLAVARFSALALVCWLVMAVSGVLNALVRIALPDLFGSYYGALLLAKTLCLLALGGLGHLQRRRAVPAVGRGGRAALLRLGALEVLLMLATIGLAVALGRSAPPVRGVQTPSLTAVAIGYDLDGPPTLARLALDWRFSLILGGAALVAAAAYLWRVRTVSGWPVARTVCWLAGCGLLLVATSSGVGRYAPAVLSVQLAQHTLLAVAVPLLLTLGAPLTLFGVTVPAEDGAVSPGPGELVGAVCRSRVAAALSSPPVALALFVLPGFLYLTGVFDALLLSHPDQLAAQAGAVLAALPLCRLLCAAGPSGRATRLLALGVAVAGQVVFGLLVRDAAGRLGETFYRGLRLPWASDLGADQSRAGLLVILLGVVPLLALLPVLCGRRDAPVDVTVP